MSIPAPSASSALSPAGSFSVISSVDSQSRSSSPSYEDVDGAASLSQSFSELSSSVSVDGAPHVASSLNLSEDEGDEFILIPEGSNILSVSLQSQVSVVPAPAESTSRMATPFAGHRQVPEREEENDAEDEEDNASASSEDDDDARNEEDARARQRMLRSQDFAEAADSGSDDDVVLATTSRMGDLSISHDRAPSALSVRTLTHLAAATPVPSQPIRLPPATVPVVVQPQTVTVRPPRTLEQVEARRLKKQRQNARRRERPQQQALSDSGSSTTDAGHSSDRSAGNPAYDAAVAFITKYLASPPQQPSVADQLRLLQSIITELGLLTSNSPMPQSIKACKKLIKQHVHINVKDYLARRLKQVEVAQAQAGAQTKRKVQVGAGVTELKKLMFPSKAALMQSLKGNKKKIMSRQAIKKAGLNVFMVVVFH